MWPTAINRTAAAALVGKEHRDRNPDHRGDEPYNFFMAAHFPDDQLTILITTAW